MLKYLNRFGAHNRRSKVVYNNRLKDHSSIAGLEVCSPNYDVILDQSHVGLMPISQYLTFSVECR